MTPKQELFCLEYLKDLNATQTAIRAGYSEKTARQMGNENLSKPDIAVRIQELMAARTERTLVDADRVLQQIARLAFCDIRQLYRDDGSLKLPHEWDADTAAAVAGVDVVEASSSKEEGAFRQTVKKVRLWDKKGALDLLGRHLKLFTDMVEVKDVTPMADRMKLARERARVKRA